jgi:hypothetical protein
MATSTISALTNTNTIDGNTVVPADFSGATYKVSANTLGSFITNNATTVSATGNITGNYFIGNGSLLTGVDATQIINGTSNVKVVSSGGNVTTSVGGTSNVIVVTSGAVAITGDLSVSGNATLSGNILGDRIQNGTTQIDIQTLNGNANITIAGTSNVAVFATSGVFITGVNSVSGNVTGGNLLTGGLVSATANVTGGNLLTAGLISATSTITGTSHLGSVVSVTANVTGGNLLTGGLISATGNVNVGNLINAGLTSVTGNITGGNLLTGGLISATATITGGNLTTAGILTVNSGAAATAIVNGAGNATGNIGSSSVYFNRLFAQATTALYADLAENYLGDADYTPGTVVDFGGTQEITISTVDSSKRVAGVVSTNPAHLMNAGVVGEHVVTVALIGRVPVSVTGTVRKGDLMVSAGDGTARAVTIASPKVGTIIGKSLEDFGGDKGTIEIVIGKH